MKYKKKSESVFDDLRIFSVGLNGYLIEWSLLTLAPKVIRKYIMQLYYQNIGGAIWDYDLTKDKKHLIISSYVVCPKLIKLSKENLSLARQYTNTGIKILSIKLYEKHFYTGHSDGSIRK